MRTNYCYVASPVAYHLKNGNIKDIKKEALFYCNLVYKERGLMPVSSVLMYADLFLKYTGEIERDKALELSFKLIDICTFFAYNKENLSKSDGMQLELDYARKLKKGLICI